MLPEDAGGARLIGRVWRPEVGGPSVAIVRDGMLLDATRSFPTVADFLDADDPAEAFDRLEGEALGPVEDFVRDPAAMRPGAERPCLLAPCDLQAIKACGVTFARSMIERVIDERTGGDPARAEAIRARIGTLIGGSLRNVRAGSEEADHVREALQREGLWSQYLEVGIGPDAEIFTKAQPMAAVGHGALVGVNRISRWNNPEPEVVLAVSSRGAIRGATLGNDVNLRDVEGRSALLLGKAKDNNASCAIGPFIRLFDPGFQLADVEAAELSMTVSGAADGFAMTGTSDMAEISRPPAELAGQAIGAAHQYPDGFMLFLGTMFAPTQDRDAAGGGFTHKPGDTVEIATPRLGTLRNTVVFADEAPPWTFGTRALMRNLGERALL
jgi:fumarylacetoacetate (FAA) hydrolase family protein